MKGPDHELLLDSSASSAHAPCMMQGGQRAHSLARGSLLDLPPASSLHQRPFKNCQL
jgi:hypothetical protein